MKIKKFMVFFVIFALLFSCATMQSNKTNNKKNSNKIVKKKDNKKNYSYKSIKDKKKITKNNKKNKQFNSSGNNNFMKSIQKFGKGVADISISIWKVIVKFFNDSYAYIAKELNKFANTKTMKSLNKTWD